MHQGNSLCGLKRKIPLRREAGAARIAEFAAGKQFEDYESSAMRRAATERQFEIISEAPAQMVGQRR
jgi:uncharacterized protein with HEPN domain